MIHYPENVVRVMQPQIYAVKRAIDLHFKRRHTHGRTPVRNWIGEYRRIVKGSGYDVALRMIQDRSASK